jgi:hypothetical protein
MNTRKYNQLTKEIFGDKYNFTPVKDGIVKKIANRTSSSPSRVSNSNTKKKSK